ncbi:LytTR family DNA-binding domain-containing protein [Dyadobacter sp. 32]|uniref:LytR/AlgR family response regulator transcription factor n=1 Tax=Dyadobacter sp. 32 TaxID=538966 RepID=UPI0011EE8BB9
MKDSQLLSESIFISGKEQRYEKVLYQDILYFQAEGGWVDLVTNPAGKKYRISTNLGNVEPQLNPTVFLRVSRKHIINIHHVIAVQGNMVFVGDDEILIGRLYKDDLFVRLPILRTKN